MNGSTREHPGGGGEVPPMTRRRGGMGGKGGDVPLGFPTGGRKRGCGDDTVWGGGQHVGAGRAFLPQNSIDRPYGVGEGLSSFGQKTPSISSHGTA